jgi:hypothetical protein
MESLIGKKAKGFKFSGRRPNYNPLMDEFENVIGEIRYTNSDVIQIKFPNGSIWNYPYEKALDHLVEEELEEEQSIEEILNNIKNLTKQI